MLTPDPVFDAVTIDGLLAMADGTKRSAYLLTTTANIGSIVEFFAVHCGLTGGLLARCSCLAGQV